MSKAWQIILALTFARMTMAAQFQSVPALAPWLTDGGAMSFLALGTLTGAYLLPGALVALAGGWLGQTLGDARVALMGLALMSIGGFGGWLTESYDAALGWRMLAGVGAVGLNVMLTKMAADWFDGRPDLPNAMGVLVSSWPAGIALSALVLPFVAVYAGLEAASLAPTILCAVGFVVLALVWRRPEPKVASASAASGWFTRREVALVCVAGLIWALYNVALIGVIAWTPGLLETQGMGAVPATAVTSFIGWVAIFSVAAGGWMSSRMRNRDLPAILCFAVSAIMIAALPWIGPAAGTVWMMCLIGLAIGPAAAMVMTLPVEAARPHLRALAMGVYFAIYYALMGIGPAVLGAARDVTGDAGAPHVFGGALLIACTALWFLFRQLQRRPT